MGVCYTEITQEGHPQNLNSVSLWIILIILYDFSFFLSFFFFYCSVHSECSAMNTYCFYNQERSQRYFQKGKKNNEHIDVTDIMKKVTVQN